MTLRRLCFRLLRQRHLRNDVPAHLFPTVAAAASSAALRDLIAAYNSANGRLLQRVHSLPGAPLSIDAQWKRQNGTTLARQLQAQSFRCTEPR